LQERLLIHDQIDGVDPYLALGRTLDEKTFRDDVDQKLQNVTLLQKVTQRIMSVLC